MKILVDVNLSSLWVQALEDHGFAAIHWSSVGDGRAPDSEVMKWAQENDHIVFTNDLDFGAILAVTRATAPSVIQVRAQDVSKNGKNWPLCIALHRGHYAWPAAAD